MLNIFATYMFQTDLISETKLRPYTLVLFLAQAENPSAIFALYISRLLWIALQNTSSTGTLEPLHTFHVNFLCTLLVASCCFFVLMLYTLLSMETSTFALNIKLSALVSESPLSVLSTQKIIKSV